jgi:hypothetical protein
MELRFLQEYIEPKMKSGEILSYERQIEYVLQDKFKYKGKTILPIKYRSDFNVVWSDGTLQVFDVKGNPDSMSLLKRKMISLTPNRTPDKKGDKKIERKGKTSHR